MSAAHEPAYAPSVWAWLQLEPRFELSPAGRILGQNAPAEALLRRGAVSAPGGRLKLGCPASNRALDRGLERAAVRRRSGPAQLRILVRLTDGDWRPAELFAAPDAEGVLMVLQADRSPPDEHMGAVREAFDLTGCESDVLALMCEGRCAKDVARSLDLSEHTVRSHLRALYGKLGVRGASNLLRLSQRLLA